MINEIGYEEGTVTRAARIWSWVVFGILIVGVYGASLIGSEPLQTWAMRLSFVLILVGFIILTRRSAAANQTPMVAGLPPGAWGVIGLLFLVNIINTLYSVLNGPLYGVHSVESHLDPYVPTLPPFVVPYLGLYVVLFGTQAYLAFRQLNRQLRTFLLALSIAMGTALITFLLFQTYVPTGPLDQGSYSGIFGRMLEYTNNDYYGGKWYSAFPSMHCGFATVFAITWYRRRNALWSILMIVLSVLIVIATQVLHEHYLMDALYGIVTAIFAYSVAWWALEYRPALRRERARLGSTGYSPGPADLAAD